MTYEEALAETLRLRERFDTPFGESEKRMVARLYGEVLGKAFKPTTCQQCYHDALIEVYIYLNREKAMKKKCNYRLRAGVIIACPDFYGGKIFTNDNLTDEVAREYLEKYPQAEKMFQQLPQKNTAGEDTESLPDKDTTPDKTPDKKARKAN